MPCNDSTHAPERWQPRYPDPALADPIRPGLRAHRHPPNRLHTWLFAQAKVWIDYWGNEIAVETIGADYRANIVAFCEQRAAYIRDVVVLDLATDQLAQLLAGGSLNRSVLHDLHRAYELEPTAWLAETPLLQTLTRRLARESG